jgi:hypothetical protein
MDILHLGSFTIDYRSKQIWFGDSGPVASALRLEPSPPYLIVKARLNDLPVNLMVDAGCEGIVLFANRLPEGLRGWYLPSSRALIVSGESPLTQMISGTLRIGTLPDHEVTFRVIATGRNDMGYDGIVGMRALQASRIQVDVERMTVSLR